MAHGFLRAYCRSCRKSIVVAFSCKARGLCPSCGARRPAATAAFLVDHVFPDDVPLRQWVLSVPHALRGLVAMRPAVLTAISRIFLQTVFAWQRAEAKKTGLPSPECAGVTHVQSFGGFLNRDQLGSRRRIVSAFDLVRLLNMCCLSSNPSAIVAPPPQSPHETLDKTQ